MHHIDAFRIACSGPGDTSGLENLLRSGAIVAEDIVAVMGKTEGNGCVNDFTREYATRALAQCLATWLRCTPADVEQRVAFVMSGGTEGVLSPHWTVFTRKPAQPRAPGMGKRMSIGIAFTRDFFPEEIGRMAQVLATQEAVAQAMHDGGITALEDVHFVQIKCPLLTSAKIADAQARGASVVTHDTYESMAYSRGASSLGVALATQEVPVTAVDDEAILQRWDLFSAVASASSGIEIDHNVVIVLGMSERASSNLAIAHAVMVDAIDAKAIQSAIAALPSTAGQLDCIVNVFAKTEASPDGLVRGQRHTMLVDSDIHSTRHARAVTGAVVASIAGHGMVYVSGGAEHQGPAGGGPVAVVARLTSEGDAA
ncbi:ring-opening amidohydrolase [Lampropedia puyangensis]|uniref:Cyanuric acid amidohydrolase n=1 Tax=Lampropedia puyangensis TaxID=1330072 RepID=A0A4S8EVU1_9BURK|nr:ring-opening amidohydrolase [Lampropedia puyangensis]THT99009.1 ring-opening amidohydrolase [Lampropedia puyangensis]